MTRFWSKPLFGVQCMQGLPRGYAAVVEDFGSVAEACVRSPFKPIISQLFDDADSARSWAEEQAGVVCPIELPTARFALSGDFRSYNQTVAITTVLDPVLRSIQGHLLASEWGFSLVQATRQNC